MSTSCKTLRSFSYRPLPACDTALAVSPETLAKPQAAAEQAYERGLRDGETRARTAAQVNAAREHERLDHLVAEFERARQQYFATVEIEIVRLALNIARKILHRESQLDPLLLKGAVHAALDQIAAGTQAVLKVGPQLSAEWKQELASMDQIVNVIADPALSGDECVIECGTGAAHLSIEEQLTEIERGFFDLLACSPRTDK